MINVIAVKVFCTRRNLLYNAPYPGKGQRSTVLRVSGIFYILPQVLAAKFGVDCVKRKGDLVLVRLEETVVQYADEVFVMRKSQNLIDKSLVALSVLGRQWSEKRFHFSRKGL